MKLSGNNGNREHKPRSRAEQPRERSGRSGGRTALIVSLALVAVILAGAAVGMNYVNRINTVFPGVRLDGMDIGGMTAEETAALLREKGYDDLGDNAVSVALPLDVELNIRTDEVCSETPVEEIARVAYQACKGGSAMEDALTYLRCRFSGMELESGRALSVDRDAIRARVESAAGEVQRALLGSDMQIGEDRISVVKGATAVILDTEALSERIARAFEAQDYGPITYEGEIQTDGELDVDSLYSAVFTEKTDAVLNEDCEIIPETVGISFDKEAARALWNAAVYGETVEIPLIVDEPEVTEAELKELLFRDQLSSMSTSLWGSSSNRVNNVTKAAAAIDGIILMPGEEFSYNPTLGKRTAENGYLPAGAYSGGEVVQEYGGGICQVSSTLYYCCLYANLKITSRSCHYFPVSYLPAGLDATVSWGGPEYKFVNNRDYPIRISAYIDSDENTVNVELWGTDVDGSYVEMSYGTWLVYDEKYPDVAIGYKARTYRTVFDADGNQLSRKEESDSYYHYHDEDIKWPQEVLDERARKEAEERGEPWPPPTPTPEATPEPTPEATPEPTPEVTPEATPEPTPIPENPEETLPPEPTEPVGEGE